MTSVKDTDTAFDTIEQFVASLMAIYSEDKPLQLFNALIQKIRKGEKTEFKDLVLKAFNRFYNENKNIISAGTIGELPRNSSIEVTSGMKINIQKYYTDADIEDRANIAKTLLTIGALLNSDDMDAFKRLEDFEAKYRKLNINSGTKEGAFVNDVVNLAMNSMKNIDPNDMAGSFKSMGDALPQLINNLQGGMERGDIDPQKMVQGFQGMLGNFSSLLPQMAGDAASFLNAKEQAQQSSTASSANVPDKNDENEDIIPVVDPHQNVMSDSGMPNVFNMMKMAGSLQQSMAGNVASTEAEATQEAMMSSMAKTFGSTLSDAMSMLNDKDN